MTRIDDLVALMQQNPKGVKFKDLAKVCDHYFGKPRQKGTSHVIYKMPWRGDPRINIQKSGKEAKSYQVKQALMAINKIREEQNEK
jgi:hypothetical protein